MSSSNRLIDDRSEVHFFDLQGLSCPGVSVRNSVRSDSLAVTKLPLGSWKVYHKEHTNDLLSPWQEKTP